MQTDPTRTTRRIGVAQILTLVMGAVLVGVGIAGFFVTDSETWDQFTHHATGDELLGFELNSLHNVVHLVLGALGLIAWTRLRTSIAYGVLLAVGYGSTAIFGLFALDETWNFLSLNVADNWLHLGLALAGVAIAAIGAAELRERERVEIDLRDHVSTPVTAEPPGYRDDRDVMARGGRPTTRP
jgi:hypothetical protein